MATIGRMRIRSPQNFATITSRYPIASIYFYALTDCLFELAHEVAEDFVDRPHLYLDLSEPAIGGEPVSSVLGDLYSQYGTESTALGKRQRNQLYGAVFGCPAEPNPEGSEFQRLMHQIIEASAAFAERVLYGGEVMLRDAVISTHRPFRQYLLKLIGHSVSWARNEALGPLAEASHLILRNRGVAAVFGVDKPPILGWPYEEDANGDTLVSEISKQMWKSHKARSDETEDELITRERFSNLQRAGLRGAEALAMILAYNEGLAATTQEQATNVNTLITACYTWSVALKALKGPSAGLLLLQRPLKSSETIESRPLPLQVATTFMSHSKLPMQNR